jgi:hypothetical protein
MGARAVCSRGVAAVGLLGFAGGPVCGAVVVFGEFYRGGQDAELQDFDVFVGDISRGEC